MKPDIEKWTIVIVGQWDTRFFTPGWVGKELFDNKEINIEVPLNFMLPVRFNLEGLVLIPQNDRVIIGIKDSKDEILIKAENLSRKILDSLYYIPVNSLGVNFGFIEEDPSDLVKLFNLYDTGDLSENSYQVKSTEIKRALQHEVGILNMTHIFSEGVLKMHFNFNYGIDSAKSASDLLDGRVIKCRNFTKDLLSTVYNLGQEEG
jgi:hypothetical protein